MKSLILVSVSFLGGCSLLFDFDRDADIAAGDIVGDLVRADRSEPASFARVTAQGVGSLRRADDEGGFRVAGLAPGPWVLQVHDDEDGDGWPERTRNVATRLKVALHADNLFDEEERLQGVSLGEVDLDGTLSVSGKLLVVPIGGGQAVPPASSGVIGRLIVTREVEAPAEEDGLVEVLALGAEAQTSADGAGDFVFTGIGSGTFVVLPVVFQNPGFGLGPVLSVGEPIVVDAFAGDDVQLTDIVIEDAFGPPPGVRPVQLTLSPQPEPGALYILVTPPGVPPPPCGGAAPQPPLQPPFDQTQVVVVDAETDTIQFDASLGVFDFTVCVDDLQADLFEQTIAPPIDAVLNLGAALLREQGLNLCEREIDGETVLDCDGDGQKGLPVIFGDGDPNIALWQSCIGACRDAFGAELGDVECVVGDETFDCDDDGDGQPDVTETQACYGLGRGTDLDGDTLCSGTDPFPQCTANDPAICVSGNEDVRPPPAEEYGGVVGIDTRPFDGGFGDSGASRLGQETITERALLTTDNALFIAATRVDAFGEPNGVRLFKMGLDGALDEKFAEGGATGFNGTFATIVDVILRPNADGLDGAVGVGTLDGDAGLWVFASNAQTNFLPILTGAQVHKLIPVQGSDDVMVMATVGANAVLWQVQPEGTLNPAFGVGGELVVGVGQGVGVFEVSGLYISLRDLGGQDLVMEAADLAGVPFAAFGSPALTSSLNAEITDVEGNEREVFLVGIDGDGLNRAWAVDATDATPTFFPGGTAVLDPRGASGRPGVTVDFSDRPVFSGGIDDPTLGFSPMIVWRYDGGDIDPNFASGAGSFTHVQGTPPFGEGLRSERGRDIVVDAAGNIFVAGTIETDLDGVGVEPVVWRLLPDAPLPDNSEQPFPDSQCGNDVVETGEDCDDGNLEDGDGCASDCTIETVQLCEGVVGEPMPGGCAYFAFCSSIFEVVCADGVSCDCRIDGAITQTITPAQPPCALSAREILQGECGFDEVQAGDDVAGSTGGIDDRPSINAGTYAFDGTFDCQSIDFPPAAESYRVDLQVSDPDGDLYLTAGVGGNAAVRWDGGARVDEILSVAPNWNTDGFAGTVDGFICFEVPESQITVRVLDEAGNVSAPIILDLQP